MVLRRVIPAVLKAAVWFASAAQAAVTYHRDIGPILSRYCAPCHSPGQSGPFPLLTYDDARRRIGGRPDQHWLRRVTSDQLRRRCGRTGRRELIDCR